MSRPACDLSAAVSRISVIVPYLNARTALPALVDAIETQTVSKDTVEWIFVDNGSTDSGPAYLAQALPRAKRYVRADRRGAYAARNLGLQRATASVVAFTDADCRPEPTWLAEGLRALEQAPRAAGRVDLVPSDPPQWVERLDASRFLRQERYVREGFGATANLFVHRRVFDTIGGFDESLLSGGDHELGRRATAAGFPIVLADRAVVRHPCRKTLAALLQKAERVGFGFGQALRRDPPGLGELTARISDRLQLAARPARPRDAGPHAQIAMGHALMGASTLVGCLRGLAASHDGPIVPRWPS